MERPRVGDDDARHLLADAPQNLQIRRELFTFRWAMRLGSLKEGVRLPTIKAKNFSGLSMADFAGAI